MSPKRALHATRSHPLRTWLTWLVLACIAPAVLLAGAYLAHEHGRGRERLVQDLTATSRAVASSVDRELAGIDAALRTLASSPHLREGSTDLSSFDAQAREVAAELGLLNIVLIGPDAGAHRQLINTLRPFGQVPAEERNDTLLSVFEHPVPSVTDLFLGPVAQRPLLAVGVPVKRSSGVAYVLAAGILPERLSSIIRQQGLPSDWVVDVFDRAGHRVAGSGDTQHLLGRRAPEPLLSRMQLAPQSVVDIDALLDGAPVITAFSRVGMSQWTVSIGVPHESFAGPVQGAYARLALGTALLIALSLCAAGAVSTRLARAIGRLVPPAESLGRGERVFVPPPGVAEIDEVALALNRTSELMERTLQRANHDPLTGLANRAMFEEYIDHRIAHCRRTGESLAVLYLDLDAFKSINDEMGHAKGDELLVWVAQRLKDVVRTSDLCARLGGDEFALALVDTQRPGAEHVAEKLLHLLAHSNVVTGTHPVSASIGIAVLPATGASSHELLRRADEAMYWSKAHGRNRVAVHGALIAPSSLRGGAGDERFGECTRRALDSAQDHTNGAS